MADATRCLEFEMAQHLARLVSCIPEHVSKNVHAELLVKLADSTTTTMTDALKQFLACTSFVQMQHLMDSSLARVDAEWCEACFALRDAVLQLSRSYVHPAQDHLASCFG